MLQKLLIISTILGLSLGANNTTTTTTTTPVAKSYTVRIFVQPDPFADKVDSTETKTALDGTKGLVDSITKKQYGTVTLITAVTDEKAVQWNSEPRAEGQTNKVTVTGSVGSPAYVYCALQKNPADTPLETKKVLLMLRQLADTANTTNSTGNSTKKETPMSEAEITSLTQPAIVQNYHVSRIETTIKQLDFAFNWAANPSKRYDWMCIATSLNPASPKYVTVVKKDQVDTLAVVDPNSSDSALWSSLLSAIVLVAAVFFY